MVGYAPDDRLDNAMYEWQRGGISASYVEDGKNPLPASIFHDRLAMGDEKLWSMNGIPRSRDRGVQTLVSSLVLSRRPGKMTAKIRQVCRPGRDCADESPAA